MNIILISISHNYVFHISSFTQHQTTIVLLSHVLTGAASRGSESVFIHQNPANHKRLHSADTLITVPSSFLLNAADQQGSTSERKRSHCGPVYSNRGCYNHVVLCLIMTMCFNDNAATVS